MTSLPTTDASEALHGVPGQLEMPTTTATGHRIGRRYYSVRNRSRYRVLGVATTWELAPGGSVKLRWDNGNTTTTALDRGLDPEVCPSCDGHMNGPAWIPVARCACRAPAPFSG